MAIASDLNRVCPPLSRAPSAEWDSGTAPGVHRVVTGTAKAFGNPAYRSAGKRAFPSSLSPSCHLRRAANSPQLARPLGRLHWNPLGESSFLRRQGGVL